ncbi:MAG: hypothetical protein JWO92_1747 [Chitinophagaceae bacterium]|nr:hypothetical protein [Chitinophagaceae bacterium]
MHKFIKKHPSIIFILLFLFAGLFIQCHTSTKTCRDVKNGRFHFYGKELNKHYEIIRQDTLQKEVNLSTGDTSFWKVSWIDECTYTARYLFGGGEKSEEEKNFLLTHITFIQIQKATPKYYIVLGALDSLSSTFRIVDTVWMQAK